MLFQQRNTTWEIACRRRLPLGMKTGSLGNFSSLPFPCFPDTLIACSSSIREACGTEQLMTTLEPEVNRGDDTGEDVERS